MEQNMEQNNAPERPYNVPPSAEWVTDITVTVAGVEQNLGPGWVWLRRIGLEADFTFQGASQVEVARPASDA